MTPMLPLGHELEAEWRFRVIHERNYPFSMEMSCFTSCPHKDESVGRLKPVPFDKPFDRLRAMSKVEGHTDKGPLRHWFVACAPVLGGTLMPPVTGHEVKQDISMPTFSFLGEFKINAYP
jgi:hypothetical protein